jgi:ribosomal protein S21
MIERNERNSERSGEPRSASVEVVLRRFFRDVQQSEIMTEIKKRRYFERKLSRNARRAAAQGKESRRRVKRGY